MYIIIIIVIIIVIIIIIIIIVIVIILVLIVIVIVNIIVMIIIIIILNIIIFSPNGGSRSVELIKQEKEIDNTKLNRQERKQDKMLFVAFYILLNLVRKKYIIINFWVKRLMMNDRELSFFWFCML